MLLFTRFSYQYSLLIILTQINKDKRKRYKNVSVQKYVYLLPYQEAEIYIAQFFRFLPLLTSSHTLHQHSKNDQIISFKLPAQAVHLEFSPHRNPAFRLYFIQRVKAFALATFAAFSKMDLTK